MFCGHLQLQGRPSSWGLVCNKAFDWSLSSSWGVISKPLGFLTLGCLCYLWWDPWMTPESRTNKVPQHGGPPCYTGQPRDRGLRLCPMWYQPHPWEKKMAGDWVQPCGQWLNQLCLHNDAPIEILELAFIQVKAIFLQNLPSFQIPATSWGSPGPPSLLTSCLQNWGLPQPPPGFITH